MKHSTGSFLLAWPCVVFSAGAAYRGSHVVALSLFICALLFVALGALMMDEGQ